jgi:hypothetical protein
MPVRGALRESSALAVAEVPDDPDLKACIGHYDAQAEICRSSGISVDEAASSRRLVGSTRAGRTYLDESAYLPTGLALGVPLPSPAFTTQLTGISSTFDDAVTGFVGDSRRHFAQVPSNAYHVTVVNRSHFAASGAISTLTPSELEELAAVLPALFPVLPRIAFRRLALTANGRLLVRGVPVGGMLFAARRQLAEHFPTLRSAFPLTAHIKLGHVLVGLGAGAVAPLVRLVDELGDAVDTVLEFDSIYSLVGRIALARTRL